MPRRRLPHRAPRVKPRSGRIAAPRTRQRHDADARRGARSARLPDMAVEAAAADARRGGGRGRHRGAGRRHRRGARTTATTRTTTTRKRRRPQQEEGAGDDRRPPKRRAATRSRELPGHVLPRHGGAGRPAPRAGVRDRAQHRGAGAGPVADGARVRARARLDPRRDREGAGQAAPRGQAVPRGGRTRTPEVVDPGALALRKGGSAARSQAAGARHRSPVHRRGAGRGSARGRATKGLPIEGTIPFSTSTKAFADYVRVVGLEGAHAQGGQERVREGEPAPRRVDRAPVQPRPHAARRPDPGGQHRPDEGGRALRLPSRLPLLDLRELVDPPRDQPRARRQGPRGASAGAHDRRLPPHRQVAARAAVASSSGRRRTRSSRRRPASRRTSSRR